MPMTTEERAEFTALKDQIAALTAFVEERTPAGNALRADRSRAERKARNARINAMPPLEYVEVLEGMRDFDRAAVHTEPTTAIALARACDGELRARLLAVLSDTCAAEVAFALYTPRARSMFAIAAGKETEVRTRDVRLTAEEAERAEALGLDVEWRRVTDSTEREPYLLGLSYHSTGGWECVLSHEGAALWRSLSSAVDQAVQRGTVLVRELTDAESREVDRRAWRDAGRKRSDLPSLSE